MGLFSCGKVGRISAWGKYDSSCLLVREKAEGAGGVGGEEGKMPRLREDAISDGA
jgi:hypothetical protein